MPIGIVGRQSIRFTKHTLQKKRFMLDENYIDCHISYTKFPPEMKIFFFVIVVFLNFEVAIVQPFVHMFFFSFLKLTVSSLCNSITVSKQTRSCFVYLLLA